MITSLVDFYGDEWEEEREFFCSHGYFHCSPDLLVCAWTTTRELLDDGVYEIVLDKPDTFYIHFLAGSISRAFEIAPFETKYVAWERNGNEKLVVWDWNRIRRYYGKQQTTGTGKAHARGTASGTASDEDR